MEGNQMCVDFILESCYLSTPQKQLSLFSKRANPSNKLSNSAQTFTHLRFVLCWKNDLSSKMFYELVIQKRSMLWKPLRNSFWSPMRQQFNKMDKNNNQSWYLEHLRKPIFQLWTRKNFVTYFEIMEPFDKC